MQGRAAPASARRRIGRLVVTGGTVVAVAGLGRMASQRFAGLLADYQAELGRGTLAAVDPARLPQVVRDWLDRALPAARPWPTLIRLEQEFEMSRGDGRPWAPGTAVQVVAGGRPGFAWFARLRLAPGIEVHVHDALVRGEGFLDARFLGVVPVTRAHGAAVTRGELQRYLAELAWAPSAALTNPHLRWRSAGTDTVRVAARVGGEEGSVFLAFGADRLPAGGYAPARPRAEARGIVDRPWRGVFSGYRDVDGFLLPTRAEVEWQLNGAWSPYWRGEVTDVSFPAPA